MAKYDGLRDYLEQRPSTAAQVAMTFAEVEALVGPLPESARAYRPWWANGSQVQALAWRAAGWKVESVNQSAERVVYVRDSASVAELVRPAVSPRYADNPIRQAVAGVAETELTEELVQARLATYLASSGWTIARTANTATRERGIDVLASLGERTLAVEVKGYPGTRYTDARRAGEVKPTAPASQARHWYAQAVLKAMLTRDDHPEYELAIALPLVPTYQALAARTKSSLDRLDIVLFFVTADGTVDRY